MRVSFVTFAAAAALLVPSASWASDDAQAWTTASANVKLGENWRLSEEVTARFSDDRQGLYEIEINTLLGYRVTNKVTIWAGYTHDPNYAGGDFTVMEHRAREQITFDNLAKIGGATLSARLRLEQRWREGVDGTAWRVRPYAKLTLPIKTGGKTALVLSHESFVDLNTTPFQTVDGEERMRNLIALSTPLAKSINAEIGYLNQYRFVPDAPDTMDHVASFSLSFSF